VARPARDASARGNGAAREDPGMAWTAPKIVEVPVSMEINMYACAKRN
jgi:coenzyme PQQ precursor peptide PqqA